jgi:hypothetical protein
VSFAKLSVTDIFTRLFGYVPLTLRL